MCGQGKSSSQSVIVGGQLRPLAQRFQRPWLCPVSCSQPGWPLTPFMDLPPRVDSGVLIRLADGEAPVLGRTIVPGPRRPLSSRPLGRDAAVSHGASIFSFPGQNPDSRRRGGRPALAPGPCAARAEDSLCGALRVPEAVRYEGHSELRRAVGANAAGLPHGHAPPRALVAAPGPEPPCVKSFHLTHIVREVTRLASHRTAGGGFPLKTTAAFEQAPEGTFLLLLKLRQ